MTERLVVAGTEKPAYTIHDAERDADAANELLYKSIITEDEWKVLRGQIRTALGLPEDPS